MNQDQARALMAYLQRAHGVVPTTGAEWNQVQGALALIEGVANGMIKVDVKSATAKPEADGTTKE